MNSFQINLSPGQLRKSTTGFFKALPLSRKRKRKVRRQRSMNWLRPLSGYPPIESINLLHDPATGLDFISTKTRRHEIIECCYGHSVGVGVPLSSIINQ